jgi:peroxiredoxin
MRTMRTTVLCVLLAAVSAAAAPDPLAIRVTTLDGKAKSLTDYRGQVILLNFWSTSCAPCRVEIPWFVEFQKRWSARGFVMLGVSMDDDPASIKAFMQQQGVNYPMFEGRMVEEDIQKATGGIWGIPTTFLIGRNGQVLKKRLGLATKGEFEREIEDALR